MELDVVLGYGGAPDSPLRQIVVSKIGPHAALGYVKDALNGDLGGVGGLRLSSIKIGRLETLPQGPAGKRF